MQQSRDFLLVAARHVSLHVIWFTSDLVMVHTGSGDAFKYAGHFSSDSTVRTVRLSEPGLTV